MSPSPLLDVLPPQLLSLSLSSQSFLLVLSLNPSLQTLLLTNVLTSVHVTEFPVIEPVFLYVMNGFTAKERYLFEFTASLFFLLLPLLSFFVVSLSDIFGKSSVEKGVWFVEK